MFPGRLKKLKIFAPDAYDLVLSKLERISPKDQGDVEYLAKAVPLDPKILRDRYEKELHPNLMARESWHDGTELRMVQGKAVTLASQGKVQASIVPRGRREKQDGPAHKGYRK
jgi:Nucleotidyltransferase of unknown function (DUF6036)